MFLGLSNLSVEFRGQDTGRTTSGLNFQTISPLLLIILIVTDSQIIFDT